MFSGLWGIDKGIFFNLLMEKLEIDCFGAAETNLHWDIAQASLIKILDLKKGSRTAYVCNKNKRINKKKGETCITMKNNMDSMWKKCEKTEYVWDDGHG